MIILPFSESQHTFDVQPTDPDEHGAGSSGWPNGTAGLLIGILPWLLIFAIFYILMIRDEAEVEIAQGVKIRVVKSTISQVLSGNTKPAND